MTTPFPFTAGQVLTAAQLNDITNLPINDQTASYVLVAGDAGKRVIMNNAGATTITINDSVFTTGDTIFIANKGAGTCTITAGTATVNSSGSLALAQYGGGTLVALSASTFTFFPSGGIGYGAATGGSSSSITVGGQSYTLLDFQTDANLVVSKSGLFDCFVVAGGAGGMTGLAGTDTGGGGGAGGILEMTIYLEAATYAVDVGAGGAANTHGLGSSIGSIISTAGGSGLFGSPGTPGGSGVGGRGGIGGGAPGGGVIATTAQGNIGGNGFSNVAACGGGGGKTAAGSNAPNSTTGGAGGQGLAATTFTGSTVTDVMGSGGGGHGSTTGGAGGTGAGNGASGTGAAGNATQNGCGGGGGYGTGGTGYAGRVFVRFK